MPFYIRKSLNFGLFRLNFSKSGVGISFGITGFRISFGPKGTFLHAGRHGFYYRERLDRQSSPRAQRQGRKQTWAAKEALEKLVKATRAQAATVNEAVDRARQAAKEKEEQRAREEARQQATKAKKQPQKSPYEILGVSPGVSAEEISAAYREKAQQYHPDKVASLAPEFQELAEERMKEINQAYSVLKRGAGVVPSQAGEEVEPTVDVVEIFFEVGRNQFERGDYQQAIGSFQRVLAEKSDHVLALAYLGSAYGVLKQLHEAIAIYKRALMLMPDNPSLSYGLGVVYVMNGELEAAAQVYLTLLSTDGALAEDLKIKLEEIKALKFSQPTSSKESIAPPGPEVAQSAIPEMALGALVVAGLIIFLFFVARSGEEMLQTSPQVASNTTVLASPSSTTTPKPEAKKEKLALPMKKFAASLPQEKEVPLGAYQIIHGTRLLREPREDAEPVTWLSEGIKVRVVSVDGRWLKIESSHADRPPGYVRAEDAVAIQEQRERKEER